MSKAIWLYTSYRAACGVAVGDSFIISGGKKEKDDHALHTVAEYSQTGFVRYLPNMIQGRYRHACSYYNRDGETVGIFLFYTNNNLYNHYRSYWSPAGYNIPMEH